MADPTPTERATALEDEIDRIRAHRTALKDRHQEALSRLMTERTDLRGVHALADLVDDSLRWSA